MNEDTMDDATFLTVLGAGDSLTESWQLTAELRWSRAGVLQQKRIEAHRGKTDWVDVPREPA